MPLSTVSELGVFKMAVLIFFVVFGCFIQIWWFFSYTSWVFSLKLWGLIGANELPIWHILKAILEGPS